MDKSDDILKQAKNVMDIANAKKGLNMMKDILPIIADLNKATYDEMKKKGFTDEQAFNFSCMFTMQTILKGGK